MVIALIALVFSTTGLADAARNAVVSAIAGHPVSTMPHAGGILLLGHNRKFPAAAIPTVHERLARRRQDGGANSQAPARRPRSISGPAAWTRRPIR